MTISFRHNLLAAASVLTLALVVSGTAKAADVAALVVPDWTGFHIGAGVGYGMINHELGLDLDFGQVATGNLDWSGIGGEGVLGTIEAGYDFQINDQFLIGAQVDYTMSGISTDIDGSIAALGSASYELEASDSVSVLARGGHFVDSSTLLYGLVGWTHTWFNGDLDVRRSRVQRI